MDLYIKHGSFGGLSTYDSQFVYRLLALLFAQPFYLSLGHGTSAEDDEAFL
jgi:hypothetical protein